MTQVLLISLDDFSTVGIELPANQEIENWRRYINEAQEFDVRPHLGDIFFYDLLANWDSTAEYKDLLDGVDSYTYLTHAYRFAGLKAAICYYAYARYLPDSNKKNTDFGMVQKRNEFSDHVDSKFIQVQVNNALSAAKGFMQTALEYLNRYKTIDSALFPLWNVGIGCPSPSHAGMRMTKVGQVPGNGYGYGYNGRFSDGIDRYEY